MNAPTQQLPAHLARLGNRQLAATVSANLGVSSPPYVSIMGNRFTLVDGAGNEQPVATFDPKSGPFLDCVIVDALERVSKIFYDSAYDPNAQSYSPPPCWSDNGVGPSRQATTPQARTCAECPNNIWGSAVSAVSGKGVKACSDYQKISLLVPGMPDTVFLLRIPPNSLKTFRQYAEQYRGRDFDMNALLTRISFQAGTLGTLQFAAINWIDEATAGILAKVYESKATDGMLGRLDQPRELGLPAPAAAAALPPPTSTLNPTPQVAGVGIPMDQQPQFAPLPQGQPQFASLPQGQQVGQQVPAQETRQAVAQVPGASPPANGRRRRNTAQSAPAAPAAPNAAQAAPAAFQPAAFTPPAGMTGPAQSGPAFGIQNNAPAPDAAVSAALDGIFGPRQ